MSPRYQALEAIRKKLLGKKLSYPEIYAVMDEIANHKIGDVLTTYFAAAGFSEGFCDQEIYYLTKAMVETGEKLHFHGVVADKHSIGGTPGTRTTLIIVPVVAAAGFKIPKTSSRAITSPAGTADCMEVLAPVEFTAKQLQSLVQKVGGCIVWAGGFNLAPADDDIIEVEKPLLMESYDKILVSVMAKKIACGATHVIIDLPYGPTMKIKRRRDARILAKKFVYLARKFNIKIRVVVEKTDQPAGHGIGPVLETKDALKVLMQTADRSRVLQERSLFYAAELINLCSEGKQTRAFSRQLAKRILTSGQALEKMREIIKAQGGNHKVELKDLKPGKYSFAVKANKNGVVKQIDNKKITIICRALCAPEEKDAGIYLEKRIDDGVSQGETLFTMYTSDKMKLSEARKVLKDNQIYKI